MKLSKVIKKILILILIIYLKVHEIDYSNKIDYISAFIFCFVIVYLAYNLGLERIRERAIEKRSTEQVLQKKEKYWKILFLFISIYVFFMITIIVVKL